MKKVTAFIKSTLLGGVLLLIPLFVLALAVVKIAGLIKNIVTPLASKLPFHVPGIGKETLLTVLALLLLCFLAGIAMRGTPARHFKKALEENILIHIPGYAYLQAFSTDKLTQGREASWKPATALIDGNEVICFVIDETEHYCSVFFPAAPSPSSGTVCVREKQDIRYLPVSVSETIALIRQLGKGSAAVLEKMRVVEH